MKTIHAIASIFGIFHLGPQGVPQENVGAVLRWSPISVKLNFCKPLTEDLVSLIVLAWRLKTTDAIDLKVCTSKEVPMVGGANRISLKDLAAFTSLAIL